MNGKSRHGPILYMCVCVCIYISLKYIFPENSATYELGRIRPETIRHNAAKI